MSGANGCGVLIVLVFCIAAFATTVAVCPPGVPVVQCFADPCQVTTCPEHPDARCVSNFCGGCNARFFDDDGNDVTDTCIDPCSSIVCGVGSACKVFEPTGEGFCQPSCELQNGGCGSDQMCELMDVTCVREPCPPTVVCKDGINCAAVLCLAPNCPDPIPPPPGKCCPTCPKDCAETCSRKFCKKNPVSKCSFPLGTPCEVPHCTGECNETSCSYCKVIKKESAMPSDGIEVERNFVCLRPEFPLKG